MAYELIQDFQYTTTQKQILKLEKGTRLDEEDKNFFIIKIKNTIFKLEKDIVINNPEYFKKVDWNTEISEIIKKNKKATSPKLASLITTYISESFLKDNTIVAEDLLFTMMDACRIQYYSLKDEKYLEPINKLGWFYNEKGVYKK